MLEVFCLLNCSFVGYISKIFRVVDSQYIIKKSRSVIKHIYKVYIVLDLEA